MKRFARTKTFKTIIGASTSLLLSCAGDPLERPNLSAIGGRLNEERAREQALSSFKIRLHHSDFYSLTEPNVFNCAGDGKRFYDTREGAALDSSFINPDETLKPAFITNVSVDVTDSNANVSQNSAFACSYGDGLGVIKPSNCATFDYGAIGGIPTSLGGSIVVAGGIKNKNFANQYDSTNGQSPTVSCGPLIGVTDLTYVDGENDVNICQSDVFALAVDTLPSSEAGSDLAPNVSTPNGPISSWAKLSGTEDYSGPLGPAGGSLSYNSGAEELILFGGSVPISETVPTDPGYDSRDTWIFDIKDQTWIQVPTQSFSSADVSTAADCSTGTAANCTTVLDIQKGFGGRSLFGYVAGTGFALNGLTDSAAASDLATALVDTTDRILIIGGVRGTDVDTDTIYWHDVQRFNPTFGPDYVNIQSHITVGTDEYYTQWIDSYHTQVLSTENSAHRLQDNDDTNPPYNFGAAFAYNYTGAGANLVNTGYFIFAGGFNSTETSTTPTTTGGNLRWSARSGATADEDHADEFTAVATMPFFNAYTSFTNDILEGIEIAPIDWTDIADGGGGNNEETPEYIGGLSYVEGLDPTTNEFVLFGGINCTDYITDSGGVANCPGTSTSIAFISGAGGSRYHSLGATIPASLAGVGATPAGSAPASAGMAATRGLDGNNNPIVVAWGGTSGSTGSATDEKVYYLWDNGGTATWESVTPNNPRPAPAINGALVYSRVTQKFYLFGGYETSPTTRYSGDTWELEVSGTCQNAGSCTFTWTKLNESGGLSCYPDCTEGPSARRSHRMVEVNYNRSSISSDFTTCDDDDGCSFGIFMEGGTSDGLNTLSDRWMFDPTANGGRGHWQEMKDLPPRNLASATSFSYFVPELNRKVHKTLLFGGQTGLHNPKNASSTRLFIPPTLGDTHLYDHETQQWSRVRLLGRGINDLGSNFDSTTDTRPQEEVRQTFIADDSNADRTLLREMTPPPLAGATLVTRTFPSATSEATSSVEPLAIPQAFIIGGRKKDGSYNTLDQMYKFCAGSTGEDWVNNNGNCDAFDEDNNANSPSPMKEAVGRWLRKQPPNSNGVTGVAAADEVDPSAAYSYMGAAAYDTRNDKIVLVGGLKPANAGELITEKDNKREISGVSGSNFNVFEYTPNTISLNPATGALATNAAKATAHGYWTQAAPCFSTTQPAGRYGHSLEYDQLNGQIIMIGGYDISDVQVTQPWLEKGQNSGSTIPEIWAAKRRTSSQVSGTDASTTTCYEWREINSFGTLYDSDDLQMPTEGRGHLATAYIPNSGYNSGYYTTLDDACVDSGPISSGDPSVSKLLAGGVYINLDRTQIGPNENLLMSMTLIPLGDKNRRPDSAFFDQTEEAFFKVHLIQTDTRESEIFEQVFQPRYLTYTGSQAYPKVVDTLSIVGSPNGGPLHIQKLIPVSIDPNIDQIRIERHSGSAILVDVAIYRMGYR